MCLENMEMQGKLEKIWGRKLVARFAASVAYSNTFQGKDFHWWARPR